jgi:hypothetical protein
MVFFLGIHLLFSSICFLIWIGAIDYERIDLEDEVGTAVNMDFHFGINFPITFLMDEDGEHFLFEKVLRQLVWIFFSVSMEYNHPSKPFLQQLKGSLTLALQPLMNINAERVRLLSLVDDIDYRLDKHTCAFWIGLLIWIGG